MSHASLADPPRLGIHDRDVERRQGAYLMAVPDEEHQDLQHRMLRLTMGSLYAARDNVRAALVPSQVRPAVLDITAGSGRWAIDMAREFPHADVVGIDVTSSNLPRGKRLPPNLHFETTDPNEGMAQYAGKFNVVHARFAHLAIRDFHGFLYDCARALRPGGVLLLVDRIHALVDKDKNLLPVVEEGQPGFTWTQKIWSTIYNTHPCEARLAYSSPICWKSWLESNPNYLAVEREDLLIPLGPCKPGMSELQLHVSNLLRADVIQCLLFAKPFLVKAGLSSTTADEWIHSALVEVEDLTIRGAYGKFSYTVAIRSDRPWVERVGPSPPIDEMACRVFGAPPGQEGDEGDPMDELD